jgi:putative DNA primase/helicase
MVALVEKVGSRAVGIHRTYLNADGSGKAAVTPDKATLGPVGGGAVRLGAPRAGVWLAVGEGIETALSITEATGMPAWAALSATGLTKVIMPTAEQMILICGDNDKNGVGQRAAHALVERLVAEGRRVRLALPRQPDTDFNDVLRSGDDLKNMEASDVAA